MIKPEIKKHDICHTIVWLGGNKMDGEDFYKFEGGLSRVNACSGHIFHFLGIEDYRQSGKPYLGQLRELCQDLFHLIRHAEARHAIFVIMSPDILEAPWHKVFMRVLTKRALSQGHLVVPIVCGDFEDNICPSELYNPNYYFWSAELCARRFGALFSFSKGNSPGLTRLAELINRIMGGDLKSEEFPAYTFEECMLIAWNLNREDFNVHHPKADAIPKYPIGQDGRPVFSISIDIFRSLPAPERVLIV